MHTIMNRCTFCNIITEQIDSVKIWSNNEFTAVLDINPNIKGQTLLISKKHYASDLHDMPNACLNTIIALFASPQHS